MERLHHIYACICKLPIMLRVSVEGNLKVKRPKAWTDGEAEARSQKG